MTRVHSDLSLPEGATHAFCETSTATPRTPWHIRRLTSAGAKFGGGADTRSLCHRDVAWDLNVKLTKRHLTHACTTCVDALYEEIERQ